MCLSNIFAKPKIMRATKMKGNSCVRGTSAVEPVTFGLGVNPVWAIVMPVVRLAMVDISDVAKMIMIVAPRISLINELETIGIGLGEIMKGAL